MNNGYKKGARTPHSIVDDKGHYFGIQMTIQRNIEVGANSAHREITQDTRRVQWHRHTEETITLISGPLIVIVAGEEIRLTDYGESITISPLTKHGYKLVGGKSASITSTKPTNRENDTEWSAE